MSDLISDTQDAASTSGESKLYCTPHAFEPGMIVELIADVPAHWPERLRYYFRRDRTFVVYDVTGPEDMEASAPGYLLFDDSPFDPDKLFNRRFAIDCRGFRPVSPGVAS